MSNQSIVKLKATIKYDCKANHPDAPGVLGLEFTDTYSIDLDRFIGHDSIDSFIKRDLALVAGGGYETNTIKNVTFKIEEVN